MIDVFKVLHVIIEGDLDERTVTVDFYWVVENPGTARNYKVNLREHCKFCGWGKLFIPLVDQQQVLHNG